MFLCNWLAQNWNFVHICAFFYSYFALFIIFALNINCGPVAKHITQPTETNWPGLMHPTPSIDTKTSYDEKYHCVKI